MVSLRGKKQKEERFQHTHAHIHAFSASINPMMTYDKVQWREEEEGNKSKLRLQQKTMDERRVRTK